MTKHDTSTWVTSSAHVDWVTCTARESDLQAGLWDLGCRLLDASKLEGEDPSRWHGHGYGGWAVPGVRVASRPDSVLVQLSGRKSADHWQEAVSTSNNTSRIDLAVDCKLQPPVAALAVQLYRQMGRHRPTSGRKPRATLWTSSDGGSTLYVGARVSENFGRVYDKGQEQKTEPSGSWWRWETELKGATAKGTAIDMLLEADGSEAIGSRVRSWFLPRVGTAPPAQAGATVHNWPQDPTTDEKRLRWLSTGVRPTVQALLRTIPQERILFALGLSGAVQQSPAAAPRIPQEGRSWQPVERFTKSPTRCS